MVKGIFRSSKNLTGHFASAVILTSTLGRVPRYASADAPLLFRPWDSESEFGSAGSTLYPLSARSDIDGPAADTIRRSFLANGQKEVGHSNLSTKGCVSIYFILKV